ncbi:hypothetical protein M3J09_013384 [Ascochyta lentis]
MTCCASCSPTPIPRNHHSHWRNPSHSLATMFSTRLPLGLRLLIFATASLRQQHNTPAFTSSRPPLATTLGQVLVSLASSLRLATASPYGKKVLFIGVHYRSVGPPQA